jgi:hypothetical protein
MHPDLLHLGISVFSIQDPSKSGVLKRAPNDDLYISHSRFDKPHGGRFRAERESQGTTTAIFALCTMPFAVPVTTTL